MFMVEFALGISLASGVLFLFYYLRICSFINDSVLLHSKSKR